MLPFSDGDQLLLYTDGVTEARDNGREFYPLAEGLARHVSDEPARTLTALHDELLAHVGGRLHDDAALLLLRKPAVPAAAGRYSTTGAAMGCGDRAAEREEGRAELLASPSHGAGTGTCTPAISPVNMP